MYNQLTRGQRYAICPGLQEGKSRKAIARQINVHLPAVGREIKHNPARSSHYGRRVAQESADIRKERLPGNRRIDGKVMKEALNLLKTKGRWEWGTPRPLPPQDELQAPCQSAPEDQSAQYPRHKHTRPACQGQWKTFRGLGDGSCHRQGAFPYRKNVPAITTDNGGGFACHEKIARRIGTTVYFAGSYASWQKGAVENANKLVRQYMPEGTDFREISDEFIRQIQYKINRRPREKKLNFSSPKKKFFNLIA